MKKFLFLLATLPMVIITACSSSDEDNTSLQVIPEGKWYISNADGDDCLNVRDKETNWFELYHEWGYAAFYMEPNLGEVMVAWNIPFRVEGNVIYMEAEYQSHKIVFSEVSKNSAKGTFYYDGRTPFKVRFRK